MADGCSLCPCVLGPILPTAPGFQSLWQRGGGVECLHRHESKNYCAGVRGGEGCQEGSRILSSMATGKKDAH